MSEAVFQHVRVMEEKFEGSSVVLDNTWFENCSFENCKVFYSICSPVRSPIKGEGCSSIRRRFNALD